VNSAVLRLVEQVIGKSGRVHPADAVLRQELKARRGISSQDAAQVSRLVFSYYRWRGWFEPGQPLELQILQADDLARAFAKDPQRVPDADLVQKAIPAWIRDHFQITPEFARALQSEPQLWLRARPGQGRDLAKRLRNCRVLGEGMLADTLVYQGREDLFKSPEFHSGAFEVQDVSSQAVSWLCDPQPGQTWWDACAGEGGKLLHLSDLMRNQGLIWASDRAEWRLKRLKRRTARARVFNYRSALWDGGPKLPTKTRFDGVLIDAPCSGIGTWQRNPHARWTLRPEDIQELAEVQHQLLVNAALQVKPGGKLIYSVCTLTHSETDGVADAFEKSRLGFKAIQFNNPLAPQATPSERLFLWPQQTGGNGMFIAGWVREKG
jgi:16S rRNA (cytosine967-C5)-methyltransferase